MSVELIDPFGPALLRAARSSAEELDRATGRGAAHVQANAVKGIRRQKYRTLWAPLSPRYAARKMSQGYGPSILIREGDLSGSYATSRRGFGDYVVGTNAPGARANEFGYAPRNLPARPNLGPATKDSKDEILAEYDQALGRIWKG